jgi:hypothetical protein
MTQEQEVLAHLEHGWRITNMEAYGRYHITRLGAVIFNLRKKGHNIITRLVPQDVGAPYAEYRLS